MTNRQISKLEMFQATHTYLDAYPDMWSAIPIIGTYKNQFRTLIDEIKLVAGDQESSKVFLGENVRSLKKKIADKMDILDDVLEAYATDTDNAVLVNKASNSYSDYFRLAHEDFEIKVRVVIQDLEPYMEQLADYGATAEQLQDVKSDFDSFLAMRGKPRAYRIAPKVATKSLDELIKETTTTLEKLDNVLKRFKRSNTKFYTGYQAARQVIGN